MKKIRLLAILLVILMIPFGMFISCSDDETPDPNKDKNEDDGDADGEQTQTTPVGNKIVDDGKAVNGSLAYFTFNNAEIGNLGVREASTNSADPDFDLKPIEPYYNYFRGKRVSGGAYKVKQGAGTNKYLSIERYGEEAGAPALDFNTGTAFATELTAKHIIEFKMEFRDNLFASPVSFSGVKKTAVQPLFTVWDGVMKDCNGNVIYGEKDTDKQGWITIDIVVNDTARTYDIYIDLVKQTEGVAYSNDAYTSWNNDALTAYRFEVSNKVDNVKVDADEGFFRIDDVNIRNGEENALGDLIARNECVHDYGEVLTDYPSCKNAGRTYEKCEDCGYENELSDIPVLSHEMVTTSINGRYADQICKNCGFEQTVIIREKMLTMDEKLSELGYSYTDKNNWNAGCENYRKTSVAANTQAKFGEGGWIVWGKATGTLKAEDTEYGRMFHFECTGTTKNKFATFKFSGITSSFVIEFDYMLGNPGSGTYGPYPAFFVGMESTSTKFGKGKWGTLALTKDGCIQLYGYGQKDYDTSGPKYQMEQGKLYNIAQFYDLKNNEIDLYINGVYFDSRPFVEYDSDKFIPSDVGEYSMIKEKAYPKDNPDIYFNNFMHYPAEKEPICVLTPGIVIGSDLEGEVALEDELLNVMQPDFTVSENGRDVKVNIPAAFYLRNYVIEMSFRANDTLESGTLLQITKNGLGFDRVADIVTVDGGRLYVMGVLVSETTDVKLALSFDDNISALYVYVNGNRIAGNITLEGDFTDTAAIIRSLTFFNDCGSYDVTGLKLYTGNEVK